MENIKKIMRQNLHLILFVACGVLILSGILVILFAAPNNEGALRALVTLLGVLMILIGCAIAFYSVISLVDISSNYFLYDQTAKTNISADELTFEIVNKKMVYVMTRLVPTASKVWTDNVFEGNEEFFDGREIYRPLVAYKIIYDLVDRSGENIWKLYLSADASLIDSISQALAMNSDEELGKAFKFLHEKAEGSYDRTEKFLTDNKGYIQNKMLKYVKTNIDKFGQI